MGAMQNNGRETNAGTKKRGSVKNADRLAAFDGKGNGGGADWGGCSCDLLHAVVVAITSLGGAITLGMSRDQGAHSLTLMLDDKRTTMWYNGRADLDEELGAVLATLNAID